MEGFADGVGVALECVEGGGGVGAVFQAAEVGLGDAGAFGEVGQAQLLMLAFGDQEVEDGPQLLMLSEQRPAARLDGGGVAAVDLPGLGFEFLDLLGAELLFGASNFGHGQSSTS